MAMTDCIKSFYCSIVIVVVSTTHLDKPILA